MWWFTPCVRDVDRGGTGGAAARLGRDGRTGSDAERHDGGVSADSAGGVDRPRRRRTDAKPDRVCGGNPPRTRRATRSSSTRRTFRIRIRIDQDRTICRIL